MDTHHFMLSFLFDNRVNNSKSKSYFRQIKDSAVIKYRHFLTRCVGIALRSILSKLQGKNDFGEFKAIVTPQQCEAIKGLYQLFIRTKGKPKELEVMVLAHRYYDALLRATNIGVEKIACASDQVYCLTALLPDGQWNLASHLIAHCSESQCDFRCILLHIGRLESQRQADFVPVEENLHVDKHDYDSDDSDSEHGDSDIDEDDSTSDGGTEQDISHLDERVDGGFPQKQVREVGMYFKCVGPNP
jgi:hypothetical protein